LHDKFAFPHWGWLAVIFAIGLLSGLMAHDGNASRRWIFVAWAVVAAAAGAFFALAGALGAGWIVTASLRWSPSCSAR
jgi:hypothetical protein